MAQNATDSKITVLRHNFSEHLRTQGKKSYSTTVSDAFYILNNGDRSEFEQLLEITEYQEFSERSVSALKKILAEHSSAKGSNISSYKRAIMLLWEYLHSGDTKAEKNLLPLSDNTAPMANKKTTSDAPTNIPRPSCAEVDRYLKEWDTNPAYYEPDGVLKELFTQTHPYNTSIDDIILKAATLNTVYNTRITSIYPVAQCILSLNIDERLRKGDETLVNAIVSGFAEKDVWKHYSFATKYCSFHNPDAYPIYDSYVAKILWHYQQAENFSSFGKNIQKLDSFVNNVLKKDYATFKRIIAEFRRHFGLEKYTTKELDQYLWQFGIAHFKGK